MPVTSPSHVWTGEKRDHCLLSALSNWDITLNCHESIPPIPPPQKWIFYPVTSPSHSATRGLINNRFDKRIGFPQAKEWDIVGEMWQRDPPIALSLFILLCFFAFSGEWIHPIHPETMAFCSSFCPSCRPTFLYCWATIVRTKWRGVALVSWPIVRHLPGEFRVLHTSHFPDLFKWRQAVKALYLPHN